MFFREAHIERKTPLVAQMVKCLPATWETQGGEDPLEKEMAIHSSTLAWKIPWTEEPGRLQSMGSKESDTTERLHFTSYREVFYTVYLKMSCSLYLSNVSGLLLC